MLRLRTLDVPESPGDAGGAATGGTAVSPALLPRAVVGRVDAGPVKHAPGHTTRIAWLPPDERDISDIAYAKYQKNGA